MTSAVGGSQLLRGASLLKPDGLDPRGKVCLTAGEDRADNIFQALKPFSSQVQAAIRGRRVVIKPNNVGTQNQLCATHVECLEGVLEFLRSIGVRESVIAESAADAPTMDGFANYDYFRLEKKYGVKFLDLDQDEIESVYVFDQKDFRPHPVRMAKSLLDRQQNFVISAAKFKTHDRIVATLSLKNIVFGAPIKDPGFAWGPKRKPGAKTDKPIAHGSGFRAINYNLFALAPRLQPDLAVIDGYRGMEGNGPVGGTPVEHRVAVAGIDWVAADRVAVELMGIDFNTMGYLNFCSEAGMGIGDLSRIEVIGERVEDHVRTYRLSDNIQEQLIWMKPATVA